jgi:hypothetical protein
MSHIFRAVPSHSHGVALLELDFANFITHVSKPDRLLLFVRPRPCRQITSCLRNGCIHSHSA